MQSKLMGYFYSGNGLRLECIRVVNQDCFLIYVNDWQKE